MSTLLIRYQRGRIPYTACEADPRFSWCLYLPEIKLEQPERQLPLLVIIHGASRTADRYRDACIEFAERHGCMVLVPLFPLGIPVGEADDLYKLQRPTETHYDWLLLQMVDEVRRRYQLTDETFYLHGFSGGGQFAHRFLYLHPRRLRGVSIGAPGQITQLDRNRPWPAGVADMDECFGSCLDLTAVRQVPLQLLIGSEDAEQISDECGAVLRSRLERMELLHQNWCSLGMQPEYQQVAGVGHDGLALLPWALEFFSRQLSD